MKKWVIVAWGLAFLLTGIILKEVFFKSPYPEISFSREGVNITLFSTNKESYKEREEMKIRLLIYSNTEITNVEVKVEGIKNIRNSNYLSLRKILNLSAGENEVNFSAWMPSCNACTGIPLGVHQLNASVWHEGKVLSYATKNIWIED